MRTFGLWVLAFLITISAAIYQRTTGPTYPIRGEASFNNSVISYKLPRSHGGDHDLIFKIEVPDQNINGRIDFKRYKTKDEMTTINMIRDGIYLVGYLPHQPPAGKLAYHVYLFDDTNYITLSGEDPVIIRFKGHVPAYVLIPHIILMFAAMLFSTRTGLEALNSHNDSQKLAKWTIALLFAGGIILGPIVQKYAFGAFWTGFPFGHDLTDNKTLIAFTSWIVAFIVNKRLKNGNWWIVAAALILLIIYMIPHSLMGSELDYSKIDEACLNYQNLLPLLLSLSLWRPIARRRQHSTTH